MQKEGKLSISYVKSSSQVLIASAVLILGCQSSASPSSRPASQGKDAKIPWVAPERPENSEVALFAGGCFWCMEKPFDVIPGVYSTTSGYTAGHVKNPTYRNVSRGVTGHTEAVQVIFDPTKVTYAQLLKVFWRNIDPLAKNRQFCDAGTQYRSGIYFINAEQKKAAFASLSDIKSSGKITGTIHTEIIPAEAFYPAEEYHQDFYKKKPSHYSRYRAGCGRDRRLEQLWGKK